MLAARISKPKGKGCSPEREGDGSPRSSSEGNDCSCKEQGGSGVGEMLQGEALDSIDRRSRVNV